MNAHLKVTECHIVWLYNPSSVWENHSCGGGGQTSGGKDMAGTFMEPRFQLERGHLVAGLVFPNISADKSSLNCRTLDFYLAGICASVFLFSVYGGGDALRCNVNQVCRDFFFFWFTICFSLEVFCFVPCVFPYLMQWIPLCISLSRISRFDYFLRNTGNIFSFNQSRFLRKLSESGKFYKWSNICWP